MRFRAFSAFLFLITLLSGCDESNVDVTADRLDVPTVVRTNIDPFPPPLDTLIFNKLALECFFHLAKETNGEVYYKTGIDSISKTIIQILREHGTDGSDIVFLIDKTGSMENDIANVKQSMGLIITQLEKFQNIRLGVAAYGDMNVDGPDWWSSSDLSDDFSKTRNFINKLVVSEGGDYPESVYDGIDKLLSGTTFRPEARKMILVIGDAPSLEPPLSKTTRKDIITKCKQAGVRANIFPVLVTLFKTETFVEYSKPEKNVIEKVYPNPATDHVMVEMKNEEEYVVSLIDLSGRVWFETRHSGKALKIDLDNEIPGGAYVIRAFNLQKGLLKAEKITILR